MSDKRQRKQNHFFLLQRYPNRSSEFLRRPLRVFGASRKHRMTDGYLY